MIREGPPDLFFLDREVDRHKQADRLTLDQMFPKNAKPPRGTRYICQHSEICMYGPNGYRAEGRRGPCRHSAPHRHFNECRTFASINHHKGQASDRWVAQQPSATLEHRRQWVCTIGCSCIADLSTCQYPDPEKHRPKRLKRKEVDVVCPAAIERCVGKCAHATPHKKNKFCKDMVVNGEMRLHCQPAGRKSRSIMLKNFDLDCHRR